MDISLGKTVPVAIDGIKHIGVKNWMQQYDMPAQGREFYAIYEYVQNQYLTLFVHHARSEHAYWLAVANITFPNWVARGIFNNLMKDRLIKAGVEYVIDSEKHKIDDWAFPHPVTQLASIAQEQHLFENAKGWTKIGIRRLFASFLDDRPTYLLGNPGRSEAEWYSKEHHLHMLQLSTGLFDLPFPQTPNSVPQKSLTEKTSAFFNAIEKQYSFLPSFWRNYFEDNMKEYWHRSASIFAGCHRVFKMMPGKELYATSLSRPLNRVILAAWRQAGKSVIGFSHGNNFAYAYEKAYLYDLMSIASHIATSSKGEAQQFEELAQKHSHGLKMAIPLPPSKSRYLPLFEHLQQTVPKVTHVKTVMLVGFPFNDVFYTYIPSQHDFSNLHLEIRLAQLLKSKGYRVLYKAHPESLAESQNLFEDYVDEVIPDRFEEVFRRADCLIYTTSRTSTFGFSLLTPKPIVLLNLEEVMWYPTVFELLKKRCHVISATADAADRICFDSAEFLDSVARSPENIDFSIVHKFAL